MILLLEKAPLELNYEMNIYREFRDACSHLSEYNIIFLSVWNKYISLGTIKNFLKLSNLSYISYGIIWLHWWSILSNGFAKTADIETSQFFFMY